MIETILNAIAAALGGRVLLTGSPHGGRVQIGVSHDGPAVTSR